MSVKETLTRLALDQRGSSSGVADELWRLVNEPLWKVTRNPWMILKATPEARLSELEKNEVFKELLAHFEICPSHLWFKDNYPNSKRVIAYFSMEFGLSEALPIYSGGLGILAGDHLKTASDLGVPLIGVGLLYQVGYFRQIIDNQGTQQEVFPYNDPSELPIDPVDTRIEIPLPGRLLTLRVWKVRVGDVTLYLLDTNDQLNSPTDRGITGELYGGGSEMRLLQEIVLGIGGWHLLEKLKLIPDFCHLNEGHAAFVGIERAKYVMKITSSTFEEAIAALRPSTLFTTHTPVEAGFDRFDTELINQYFGELAPNILKLGRVKESDPLNMAILAVRLSEHVNAVSALHEEVSRDLFKSLPESVDLGHVTNGIHLPSWESPEADKFWTAACGSERWSGTLESIAEGIAGVSDQELWELRCQGRKDLLEYAHLRLNQMLISTNAESTCPLFSPDVLTIGFARRFATYKRADLLLHDKERLLKLLKNPDRPVQLIIAGKAHPEDEPGKALIEEWLRFIRDEARAHVMFLADYDILLAERLVQGVDLWINTPRRPYEASGTSGMKVLVNGGLNLSELDGWWAEAYAPNVGWAIGDRKLHDDEAAWDKEEAERVFDLLEQEIVPTFYKRDCEGLPTEWIDKMRASMTHLVPQFSTNRMVREYVTKYYMRDS